MSGTACQRLSLERRQTSWDQPPGSHTEAAPRCTASPDLAVQAGHSRPIISACKAYKHSNLGGAPLNTPVALAALEWRAPISPSILTPAAHPDALAENPDVRERRSRQYWDQTGTVWLPERHHGVSREAARSRSVGARRPWRIFCSNARVSQTSPNLPRQSRMSLVR